VLAFVTRSPAVAADSPNVAVARAHVGAIVSGNIAALDATYLPVSIIWWVGGTLDGFYSGDDQIQSVWTKFVAIQHWQSADITAISEASNPKGGTVTLDTIYHGTTALRIREILLIRGGKIQDDIWQVWP
jgi:hypothetical protein